jgi:hypothetical protein
MAKDDIKKHQFKKGQSGNPNGRPKGARNRSTTARKWLNVYVNAVNPITQKEEELNQEDLIYLALLKKARQGDVPASKAFLDSAYGQPKETLDVNADAPKVDFRKLFNFKDDTGEV